jgi:hypothetical protein
MHPRKNKYIIIGFAKGVYNNTPPFVAKASMVFGQLELFNEVLIHMVESPKNSEM